MYKPPYNSHYICKLAKEYIWSEIAYPLKNKKRKNKKEYNFKNVDIFKKKV